MRPAASRAWAARLGPRLRAGCSVVSFNLLRHAESRTSGLGNTIFRGVRRKSSYSAMTMTSMQDISHKFEILRLNNDGSTSNIQMNVKELLRHSNLGATDLIQVGAGETIRERRHAPAILPRQDAIVVSFSHVKAIIHVDHVLLFNSDQAIVQSTAAQLQKVLTHYGLESKKNGKASGTWSGGGDSGSMDTDEDQAEYSPFELVALQAMLDNVCFKYQQRVLLFQPIVSQILGDVTNSDSTLEIDRVDSLQKLLPIQDGLSQFEQRTKDGLRMLKELLDTEEDMVGLLLAEKKRQGKRKLPLELHDEVELLLESYHRVVSEVHHDVRAMRRRVETSREIAAISLDGYRNRLLKVNLHLTVAAVGIALTTTVAGLFGMNLTHGYEEAPTTYFYFVSGAATGMGAALYAGVNRHLYSHEVQKSQDSKKTVKALQILFENMDLVQQAVVECMGEDHLSKCSQVEGRQRAGLRRDDAFTKDNFLDKLRRTQGLARASGDANDHLRQAWQQEAVDVVFSVFDESNDGTVAKQEFQRTIERYDPGKDLSAS